jgi:hypothetical protein
MKKKRRTGREEEERQILCAEISTRSELKKFEKK